MNIEMVLWGILPAMVAIAACVFSIIISYKTRKVHHICASVIVFLGVIGSLFDLYNVFFRGAWPDNVGFLSHILVGV